MSSWEMVLKKALYVDEEYIERSAFNAGRVLDCFMLLRDIQKRGYTEDSYIMERVDKMVDLLASHQHQFQMVPTKKPATDKVKEIMGEKL